MHKKAPTRRKTGTANVKCAIERRVSERVYCELTNRRNALRPLGMTEPKQITEFRQNQFACVTVIGKRQRETVLSVKSSVTQTVWL